MSELVIAVDEPDENGVIYIQQSLIHTSDNSKNIHTHYRRLSAGVWEILLGQIWTSIPTAKIPVGVRSKVVHLTTTIPSRNRR